MRHLGRVVMVSATVLLFAGLAAAQQKPKPAEPAYRIIPLKVEIVLSEYDGAKKISSLPYTLGVNAVTSGNPGAVGTHLRLGVRVPITVGEQTTAGVSSVTHFQYTNMGTDIDCSARALSDGTYQLDLKIERNSASLPGAGKEMQGLQVSKQPIMFNFRVSSTLILRDGQSDESTVATDPVSGHVLRVAVTLHVVKASS